MFLEHRQYLALLDEIDYLKKDNSLLRQQNLIISQQLVKEKQQRLQLEDHHLKNMKLIEDLHAKTLTHQTDNTKQIMEKMNHYNTTTKSFLEDKFKVLENATSSQSKQTELKQAKNKLDLYELTDFANKIRTIYREYQTSDTTSNKKLSFNQITKWIKGMVMLCLTQQKFGLTGSMSTSNIKKQGKRSSKMKENKSLLNCSESKSKITIGDLQKSKHIV